MARGPSKTALLVAGYRARATARGDGLCDDRWAARLAGAAGDALSREYDTAFPPMELWIALRTAFLDAQVEHFVACDDPIRQIVMLGAGLDTRAARLAHSGVRFFEVDAPDTQADKLERLAALGDYPIAAATYVPCDFEHESFVDRLIAAGFDAAASALLVWEGVAYYLEDRAVRATLGTVAQRCAPRSVLAFDYLPRRLAEGADIDEGQRRTREILDTLAEPVKSGINDPVPLLSEAGFRYMRTPSFDQIALARTGTYDRARKFRFQSIALCSVARPIGP